MALGNITSSDLQSKGPLLNIYAFRLTFVGDTSYPTGGTAAFTTYVRAQLGASDNQPTPIAVVANDCGGFVPVYDQVADKLKVYYADYDAGADGALIEVANTTNLSGTTFNVLILAK